MQTFHGKSVVFMSWRFGEPCSTQANTQKDNSIKVMNMFVSIYLLTMLSVDRYISIVRASFQSSNKIKNGRSLKRTLARKWTFLSHARSSFSSKSMMSQRGRWKRAEANLALYAETTVHFSISGPSIFEYPMSIFWLATSTLIVYIYSQSFIMNL